MSSDVIEPSVGSGVVGPPDPSPPVPPAEHGHGHGPRPPQDVATSSSGDDLTVSLTQARPDPLLGGLDHDPEQPAVAPVPRAPVLPEPYPATPPPDAEGAHQAPRADALNALAALDVTATDATVPPPGSDILATASTSGAFVMPAFDAGPRAERPPLEAPGDDAEEDDEGDEPAPRGSSLAMMLLASYASAVTLGLIWVLWTGRRVREGPEPDFLPPADTRPDPGRRADRSHRLIAPPPVAAEHLTTLGKMVRLGLIEATPLSITSGPVALDRGVVQRETKSGGDDALKLRLRLRNVSTETVIAPLDEAFLRERVSADPDSFIETNGGGPSIAMYPLAVESEWSIAGQEIRELKPGEVLETVVVSAPESRAKTSPEMTWRVRLRTDINHTDDLGVRFRQDEIKAGP